MLKLMWYEGDDEFATCTVIGGVISIYHLNYILTHPDMKIQDGCKPQNIVATNLDGDIVDMNRGINYCYSHSTRLSNNIS